MMNRRLLLLISFVISSIARAEIAVTDIKGMYNDIIDGKKYLSPVHGLNWYRTGIIENMYRFGDDSQASIKLIKEMFHLIPNGFDITNSNGNPAKYFTPKTIGKILNYLENNEITSESVQQSLQDLYGIISADIGFNKDELKKLQEDHKEFMNNNKLLEVQIKQVKKGRKSEQKKNEEISNLKKRIRDNDEKMMKLSAQIEHIREFTTNITEKKIKDLIAMMLDCLNQDQDGFNFPNTLHNILLSFAWKKANSVAQIKEYFAQFNPLIIYKNWGALSYNKQDYEKLNISIKNNPAVILNDYEKSSFYSWAIKVWGSPYSPIIGGISDAQYVSPDGKIYLFSNCGEASLENFFNIVLFNSNKGIFDVSILRNNKNITPLPALIDYYQKYNQASEVNTNSYHHAWAQLVSALPGVNYAEGDYVINAGLENVLKVINHLIFGNSPEFDRKTTKEKLNQITTALSRDGFTLRWRIIQGALEDDVDIVLQFKLEGLSDFVFEWQFYPQHFVIPVIASNNSEIKFKIAQQLVKADLPNFYVLGWYKYESVLEKLVDHNIQNLKLAIYMQNLAYSYVVGNVVLILLKGKIIDKSLIIKLCKSLPSDMQIFGPIIESLPEEPGYKDFIDAFVMQLMINKPILQLIVKQQKKWLYGYITQDNINQLDNINLASLMHVIIKANAKTFDWVIQKALNKLDPIDRGIIMRLRHDQY